MSANDYYTYLLVDPRNNLPFYVGKGRGRRCLAHFMEAANTKKNNAKLAKIRKIESLGLSVVVNKVDSNVSDEQAQEFEIFLIQELRNSGLRLTNQTDGGDGSSGYKHTDNAIKKIGDSQRGRSKPMSQRIKLSAYLTENPIHSRPGVKAKVSGENHWCYGEPAPNSGKPMSLEQRQLISKRLSGENHPFYGKPCSDERRAAISAATKGVKKSNTENMKKPKSKIECPHCHKFVSGGNLVRWHGENCKERVL